MDPQKLADVFYDDRLMANVIETISKIDAGVTRIADRLSVTTEKTDRLLGTTTQGIKTINEQLEQSQKHFEDLDALTEKTIGRWERLGQVMKGAFDQAAMGAQKLGEHMIRLQTNPETTVMQGVRSVPYVGPFLELMVNAQRRVTQAEASGRSALMGFEKTGTMSPEFIREQGNVIGRQMLDLEERFLATRQEVGAVFNAFAEGGVKVQSVLKDAGFSVKGFGTTVSEVSLGIDK